MVNYLVTGGAGFIGSHLVDELLGQEDSKVTVIGRSATEKHANYAHHSDDSRLEVYEEDITEDLDWLFDNGRYDIPKFETVFHFSSNYFSTLF